MTCAGCDPCPLATADKAAPAYELHVTVAAPYSMRNFQWACEVAGAKALVINLAGAAPAQQVMTSQTVTGDWRTALARTVRVLRLSCHEVLRQKVEAAPWCPEVPTLFNGLAFTGGRYMEGHLLVRVTDPIRLLELRTRARMYRVHMSANPFKPDRYFITVRQAQPLEEFQDYLTALGELLAAHGYPVERTQVEYTLMDTNLELDGDWGR